MEEDTIYVAVGKDVNENKLTLSWALRNFQGNHFCILHVHQLPQIIASLRTKYATSGLEKDELIYLLDRKFMRKIEEAGALFDKYEAKEAVQRERKNLQKILDNYILICHRIGVHAKKLHIEMDDVGKGIVELLQRHSIKKLVMGAAANEHYSESMDYIKSKKALYVHAHAPISCQTWFICRGHLIYSRKNGLDCVNHRDTHASLHLQASSIAESGRSNPGRSSSASIDSPTDDELHHLLTSNDLEGSSDNFKREAFEEMVRHVKAENSEVIWKARALERSYTEELRFTKEIEVVLANLIEDIENMKTQWDEELLSAQDQRALLGGLVAIFKNRVKKLANKRLLAEEHSQLYKKERNDNDNALEVTEDLLKKQACKASSSLYMHQSFPMYSLSEIHEATRYFDPSLKITEQEYGSIYKGFLHHTPVTIKVLNLDSLQGPSKFQQEVNVMNKFRHPNVITVIGVCQEARALIYEHLPNGSLEDRLNCKDNTSPLSWQTRICIATDICSVLIFLHSSNPQSITHGDLKAANVLIDASFVCKLSDFDIYHYRQLPLTEEISSKSDIYSFGIILLQLLTGRSSLNLAEEMQEVLDGGNLEAFLDYTAGDWPFVEAKQLAHMALRCCDIEPSKRPDLVSEAWRVLKPMRATCGASSSLWTGSRDHSKPPSYFICPILLEVMQDPVVAADGYTYEAEALKGWLESGHDTSPMTNLRLPHHQVVPNHSLRSAIQEWLDIPT
ncbi:hypothetical protein Ddye_017776 [Dipteronia dyeriana]|uniref:RING-type E3 ubiquitin transferase n=1 Tax=Dipteronia dyeriana TaxID=168575 RepID=A0AAD9U9B4_9ROSI|nr:hypothetical protein Ddye_017776 [Dipteronia dyeriana]